MWIIGCVMCKWMDISKANPISKKESRWANQHSGKENERHKWSEYLQFLFADVHFWYVRVGFWSNKINVRFSVVIQFDLSIHAYFSDPKIAKLCSMSSYFTLLEQHIEVRRGKCHHGSNLNMYNLAHPPPSAVLLSINSEQMLLWGNNRWPMMVLLPYPLVTLCRRWYQCIWPKHISTFPVHVAHLRRWRAVE